MADLVPTWRTYRTFAPVHFVSSSGIEYSRLSLSLHERDRQYVDDCRDLSLISDNEEILDFRITVKMTRAGYSGFGPIADSVLSLREAGSLRPKREFSCVVVSVGIHTRSNESRSGTKSIGRCVVRGLAATPADDAFEPVKRKATHQTPTPGCCTAQSLR